MSARSLPASADTSDIIVSPFSSKLFVNALKLVSTSSLRYVGINYDKGRETSAILFVRILSTCEARRYIEDGRGQKEVDFGEDLDCAQDARKLWRSGLLSLNPLVKLARHLQ